MFNLKINRMGHPMWRDLLSLNETRKEELLK